MDEGLALLNNYLTLISPNLLSNLNGKVAEFVSLLKDGITSEDLIKEKVCKKQQGKNYYANLKNRVLESLQILALMSSSASGNPVKKKYEICQKKFFLGQKFLTRSEREEGIRLIKQAYQLALEYDFTHLTPELSSILYHHHIYYQPNERLANHYLEAFNQSLEAYQAEKNVEHALYRVLQYKGKTAPLVLIENTLKDIDANRGRGNSIKHLVYLTVLKIQKGFYAGDLPFVIRTCKAALKEFKQRKGVYISHYHSIYKSKGIAELTIGSYAEAEKSFLAADEFCGARSYNAYIVQFYQTLNALHSGDYQTAYKLYRQNRRCRFPSLRLQFAIIEAYLCFLNHMGELQIDRIFRLGKYLNETIKAQADKQGDNINILIAELLILFIRDRGKFIDRIDAVQHYSYRHLRSEDTRRARWFIKILCLLPKANFHPAALERRAKTYIEKLEHHPVASGENFAIEIIPFERLLQMIFQRLKQKVA